MTLIHCILERREFESQGRPRYCTGVILIRLCSWWVILVFWVCICKIMLLQKSRLCEIFYLREENPNWDHNNTELSRREVGLYTRNAPPLPNRACKNSLFAVTSLALRYSIKTPGNVRFARQIVPMDIRTLEILVYTTWTCTVPGAACFWYRQCSVHYETGR